MMSGRSRISRELKWWQKQNVQNGIFFFFATVGKNLFLYACFYCIFSLKIGVGYLFSKYAVIGKYETVEIKEKYKEDDHSKSELYRLIKVLKEVFGIINNLFSLLAIRGQSEQEKNLNRHKLQMMLRLESKCL